MKSLQICTYNVRNDNLSDNLTKTKLKEIYLNLINDYNIDILATQEMVEKTVEVLKKELTGYHVIGNYRYGNNKLLKNIKSIKKYNEGNNIITRLTILTEQTNKLPWIPRNIKELYSGIFKYKSIMPRITTEAILEIPDYGRVRFINTHLSHHLKQTTKLQLIRLISKIKSSTIPVILTGDFNINLSNKFFKKYFNEIESLGLKRVEFNGRTFKKSKKEQAIDHIFIPNNWLVKEVKIIDEEYLDDYSDHYPLLISVIPKK